MQLPWKCVGIFRLSWLCVAYVCREKKLWFPQCRIYTSHIFLFLSPILQAVARKKDARPRWDNHSLELFVIRNFISDYKIDINEIGNLLQYFSRFFIHVRYLHVSLLIQQSPLIPGAIFGYLIVLWTLLEQCRQNWIGKYISYLIMTY